MKNSLADLNDHLFTCLEGLMDDELSPEDLEKEIKRANTVTGVAQTIINNANVQINALKLVSNGILKKAELPEMIAPKNTSGRKLIGMGGADAGEVLD